MWRKIRRNRRFHRKFTAFYKNRPNFKHFSLYQNSVRRFRFRLLIIIAVLLVAISFSAVKMRPIIISCAVERADAVISNIVYDSIIDVLSCEKFSGEYADITYDNSGKVKSLSCDTVKLNLFMTQVNNTVEKRIAQNNCGDVSVHLGTLLGFTSTLGRGPEITCKYDLITNVNCSVKSELKSAGINQSKLLIILNVSVSTQVCIPFCSKHKIVRSDFPVSETLLLGDVPGKYTNINLKSS